MISHPQKTTDGSKKHHHTDKRVREAPCLGGLAATNARLFWGYKRAAGDKRNEIHPYTYMNDEQTDE